MVKYWQPKSRQKFKLRLPRFSWPLLFLVVGLVSFALLTIGFITYIYFAGDLVSKESIMNRNNTGVVLLDRSGKPFFSFYEGRASTFAPLNEIPNDLRNAIIAVEDKDFYNHPGFSIKAIGAAIIADVKRQELRFGGSTITQQLVKNVLLTHDKTFLRKYQEIILAAEIDRRYSKDEILEMYLNSVYFGEGAYGVGDAAQVYFGKGVSTLNLAQSVVLASLPVAPSRLSPISGDKEELKGRVQFVLSKMVEQAHIKDDQRKEAEQTQLTYQTQKDMEPSHAAHFALMVKEELKRQFGEEKVSRSGFKVTTTLDLDWQTYAEDQVFNQVKKLASSKVSNGAAVVMDPKTGEVKALVGSYNWYDDKFGKVNIADTPRQPGSAFKPIVYTAGLEKRIITPATVLHDTPISIPQSDGQAYKPVNYDGRFRGDVLVRRALANSLNIPAVEVMQKVGVGSGLDMAKRLGITTLEDSSLYGLSLVLGSGEVKLLEMTGVYATFANGGIKAKPILITKIDDKDGDRVFTSGISANKVLDPEVAFLLSSILSDNNARAEVFGNALTISKPAAVKTGTTNDYKDSWTVGYTPSLAVGVWVGNNDNTPMDRIAGSLGAAPIWRNLMEKYLAGTPIERFSPPTSIVQRSICRSNGLLLTDNPATSSAQLEYFLKGSEPTKVCVIELPPPPPEATPTPVPNGGFQPGNPEDRRESRQIRNRLAQLQRELAERRKKIFNKEKSEEY